MSEEHDKFCWKSLAIDPDEVDCGCENIREIRQDELTGVVSLLEDLKPSCYCDDCKDYSERSRDYLTGIQNLIKGEN